MNNTLTFSTKNRGDWIRNIANYSNSITTLNNTFKEVLITLNNINEEDIDPFHLVTCACLIQQLINNGYKVSVEINSKDLYDFWMKKTKFHTYWEQTYNYTPATTSEIFNLWRIADDEKEVFGRLVHEYLQQQHIFKNKDLSMVELSLTEAYYNIFDHANANGNAFSFVKYCSVREMLKIAICDFGDGIANTLRNKFSNIKTDAEAIARSLEIGVTTQSKPHNAGMGLDNIRSACGETEYLRIVSNNGLVLANNETVKQYDTSLNFKGTLIYYDIPLNSFEDLEILPNFTIL